MIEFKVRPEGGELFEVTATTRDILSWEKVTKGASLKQLMENLHTADLYKVAHFAAKRQQLFTGSLQEFEETCDLEFEIEEEGQDPTPSAR
ncbi:hypothetical protein B0I33_104502 [Prauserella shujinwangii]|uniref:Tail assembly chaperone n=1 Tax=Prauserella shujinwangii TaxID=1453103 RepID=A0A2T0LXD0_9PSEU|nr:hypothetical protein [Prauserella shujinwangii]PRX48684.1 hypothetical protein B0I33_104502 [Prauserella shujinwangii]